MSSDLSRHGVGISDDWRLSQLLASRFAYTNTFLHRYPILDIADPPDILMNSLEFVLCSDVLEHVLGDVDIAIRGLYSILRPGGFVVASIPLSGSEHIEYFPDCTTVQAFENAVEWTDKFGKLHVNQSPIYHGGDGRTLTFRQFTERSFADALTKGGFVDVRKLSRYPAVSRRANFSAGLLIANKPT